MEKPNFEHPQPQSSLPQGYAPNTQAETTDKFNDLQSYIDRRISDHIHDGRDSIRIDAQTNIVNQLGGASYGGRVASSGTAVVLPNGWTSSLSTFVYTVTHNLNTTNYSVVANAYSATPTSDVVSAVISSIGANSFTVQFVYFSSSYVGTAANTDFNFTLTTIN